MKTSIVDPRSLKAEEFEVLLEGYFAFLVFEESVRKEQARNICRVLKRRHKNGSFGVCTKCGRKINPVVLLFLPDQPHCHECEKKAVNKHMRGASRKIGDLFLVSTHSVYAFGYK